MNGIVAKFSRSLLPPPALPVLMIYLVAAFIILFYLSFVIFLTVFSYYVLLLAHLFFLFLFYFVFIFYLLFPSTHMHKYFQISHSSNFVSYVLTPFFTQHSLPFGYFLCDLFIHIIMHSYYLVSDIPILRRGHALTGGPETYQRNAIFCCQIIAQK